jgi:glycerol-3-phosphate acyltransferase PlsY
MQWLAFAFLVMTAYLLGSIPTGVILGLWLKGVDVRQFGSGKTGATNSLRTLGWRISLAVFLIDGLKGALAVWFPSFFFTNASNDWLPWVVMICAITCMLGHNYSVWINFKGGRGVAVGVGELLVVSPFGWFLTFLVTFPTILFTRYVSLGSVVGSAFTPIALVAAVYVTGMDVRYLGFAFATATMVIWMHRDNIKRLLNGTERKLGDKAKPVEPSKTPHKEKAGQL